MERGRAQRALALAGSVQRFGIRERARSERSELGWTGLPVTERLSTLQRGCCPLLF